MLYEHSLTCLLVCLVTLWSTLDAKPHGDLIIIGGGGGGGHGHHHHHSHPHYIPIPIPIPMHNYHTTKIHMPSHGKPFNQHITVKGPKGYAYGGHSHAYSHHANHHHEHEGYEEDHDQGHDSYGGHGEPYKDEMMYNDDYGGPYHGYHRYY